MEPVLADHEACQVLRKLAPTRWCPPAVEFFRQGAPATEIYLLDRGAVKLIHLTADGRELIVGLRFSGSVLGLPPAVLAEAHPASGITLTRCSFRRVAICAFLSTIAADARLCHYVLKEHCRELLDQTHQLAGIALSARERLERIILRLAMDDQASQNRASKCIRLRPLLRQWEIAQLIGVTPQHLSRLLKRMQEDGLIRIEKGRLIIVDPSRLGVR